MKTSYKKLLLVGGFTLFLLIIFTATTQAQITNPVIDPSIGDVGSGDTTTAAQSVIEKIFQLVLPAAILLLLVYLIWGAFDWITSGGDSSKVSAARNKMTQAVIGLLVLASVFAIVSLIESILGFRFLYRLLPTGQSKNQIESSQPTIKSSGELEGGDPERR